MALCDVTRRSIIGVPPPSSKPLPWQWQLSHGMRHSHATQCEQEVTFKFLAVVFQNTWAHKNAKAQVGGAVCILRACSSSSYNKNHDLFVHIRPAGPQDAQGSPASRCSLFRARCSHATQPSGALCFQQQTGTHGAAGAELKVNVQQRLHCLPCKYPRLSGHHHAKTQTKLHCGSHGCKHSLLHLREFFAHAADKSRRFINILHCFENPCWRVELLCARMRRWQSSGSLPTGRRRGCLGHGRASCWRMHAQGNPTTCAVACSSRVTGHRL
jgi:hypothetical protein